MKNSVVNLIWGNRILRNFKGIMTMNLRVDNDTGSNSTATASFRVDYDVILRHY